MKVTTNDIARKAGVSQTTVSLVLNNNTKVSISPQTKELVLRTAAELGYQFKKREKEANKTIIGLLVPTLSNLYYPNLAQNIENHAATLGITIVVQNTMRSVEKERECFDVLRTIGAKGILCLYTPTTTIKDIPMILVGEKADEIGADVISLNCFEAGKMLAQHLLESGYKKIAYLSTPLSNITVARQKRLDGIRKAMEESGCADDLIVLADTEENESMNIAFETQCGQRLTRQLLQQYPDCQAIIAVNDMTAYGCMHVLQEQGKRIPEDIALCGFDNLFLDEVISPTLTSVEQMAFHGCKIALNMLLDKIKNPNVREQQLYLEYKPQLHIRSSTAKK
jgi:LacI family transcriptional regulator